MIWLGSKRIIHETMSCVHILCTWDSADSCVKRQLITRTKWPMCWACVYTAWIYNILLNFNKEKEFWKYIAIPLVCTIFGVFGIVTDFGRFQKSHNFDTQVQQPQFWCWYFVNVITLSAAGIQKRLQFKSVAKPTTLHGVFFIVDNLISSW